MVPDTLIFILKDLNGLSASDFARCMNEGKIPKPDRKEGIHTLAVMQAMDESIRTGAVVKGIRRSEKRKIEL